MHMRKKKWAENELASCPFYFDSARALSGRWRALFAHAGELHVELGCGKCVSTALLARETPGINYVALDLSRDMLAVARRNIVAAYRETPVNNIVLSCHNLLYVQQIFSPADAVDRLYINFCNPWDQKIHHERRRLVHTRQLLQYRTFLKPGAQLYFKTDNDALFDAALGYLDESGFSVSFLTRDLYQSGYAPNYPTEHELRFAAAGVPIKFLQAVMQPLAPERERVLRVCWLGDEATQRRILQPEAAR